MPFFKTIVVTISLSVLFLSTYAEAGCSVSLTSPSGAVRGPFNVTGNVVCTGGTQPFKFAPSISGAANIDYWCYSGDGTCIYDFQSKNHGVAMELSSGEHTFELKVYANDQQWYSSGVQTVMVDNAPTVSLNSPSGAIRGYYEISGSAVFAPTQSATKGEVRIFLGNTDYFNSPYKKIVCTTENCPFSFPGNMDNWQGNLTVIAVAIGGGAYVQTATTVTNDVSPVVTAIGPVGTVSTSQLFGHASFVPISAWDGFIGNLNAYLDGKGIGGARCVSAECDVKATIYNLSAGRHTVFFEAVPWWTGVPKVRTPESVFFVEEYKKTDFPRDFKADVCGESEFNVISGNVSHDQELFATSGGPLPTKFSLFYDSMDQINIAPTIGYQKTFKMPYGQGWTTSYDIALYNNPTSKEKVLRGGGLAKRFYTPSGTNYISQPGDSSVLVKNSNNTYTITHRDGLKYNFDANGLLISIVDRFSNAVTLDRSVAKTLKVNDPAGRQTVLGYDGYGERVLTITDPGGNVFNLEYNPWGMLTKINYPPVDGGTRPSWTYTYNSTYLLETKTDPRGQVVRYEYDGQRRVKKSVDPEGIIDPVGHAKVLSFGTGNTSFTEKDGGVWSYAVNATSGLVNSKVDPLGGATSYTYNAAGYVATETSTVDGSTNRVKSYQYDSYGNITDVQGYSVVDGIVQAADVHMGYAYANGNYDQITSITDYVSNLTTGIVYDQDGAFKRTRVTSPTGAVTTVRQNANGTVNDVAYPDGKTLTYVYTSSKLLQSVKDNHNVKTEFSNFTVKGQPQTVKVYDAGGIVRSTTNITYDNSGRVKTTTVLGASDNYVTTFGYDAMGNVATAQDANLNSTAYAHNYKGLPKQITDALGKVTALEYVSSENLSALVDANGNRTGFSYDPRGLLTKETPPVGVAIRYEYNAAGQVKQKINDTTGEALISYGYDAQGRLTGRSYLDGTSDSFGYDGVGRLASASNQNISYTFGYDGVGRLVSQTDGSGNVVAYTYDAAGRRTSLSVNSAHTVNYGYTADKLTSITSNLAGAFGFGYDTLGRRSTLSYPNGITGTYTYNADQPGWLSGISYQGNQPIYSVAYPNFDKVGNRTAKNEGTPVSYGYDAVYRLLSSTAGEVFTHDNAGNRLSDSARLYTVTAGNVMASAGAISHTYDSYGNTITAGPWTYGWNSQNQLVSVNNVSTSAAYVYDPFGRRVGKTVNGVTTSYVYDGQDIAASIAGGTTAHFVHGPGVDEHLALNQAGQNYFYHADGLGSILRITDASQNITQSYNYTSFGTPSLTTGFQQPYQFTGREYDPETGNNYHRARYLNMDTGRWLSSDPLGLAGGDVVLSNYVGGNAVNYSDPSGLVKWKDAGMATLGLVNSGFGMVFGSGLALLPEPTFLTKAAAAVVLSKSLYGAGANGVNLVAAIRDKNSVSTGGLFTDVACKVSNGNKKIKGMAAAADLGFDLAAGNIAGTVAKSSSGFMSSYSLQRIFVKNPAELGKVGSAVQLGDATKSGLETYYDFR